LFDAENSIAVSRAEGVAEGDIAILFAGGIPMRSAPWKAGRQARLAARVRKCASRMRCLVGREARAYAGASSLCVFFFMVEKKRLNSETAIGLGGLREDVGADVYWVFPKELS
jgi:hypothetical protein